MAASFQNATQGVCCSTSWWAARTMNSGPTAISGQGRSLCPCRRVAGSGQPVVDRRAGDVQGQARAGGRRAYPAPARSDPALLLRWVITRRRRGGGAAQRRLSHVGRAG
jgi:hypothetical protein